MIGTIVGILLGIGLILLGGSYICFRMAYYVDRKKDDTGEEFSLPPGEIYLPHHDQMVAWMKEVRRLPCQEVCITSHDGLKLYGKYYECRPGAPIELMFHGYRGNAERDLCGGVQRSFSLGHNALLVDQRTSGKSGGTVISFGINESKDCLRWVDFAIEHFGKDVRLILTGISMGAATVLLAGGRELPENVVGILADCGYSSPKAIIQKVILQLKLPAKLLYPLVRLGALLYGRFDPEEDSPLEAMKRCKLPVIFFHGEDDDYVPCEMSRENYAACASRKHLMTVPGAGHGLCYIIAPEEYLQALREFFDPLLEETTTISR